MDIVSVLVDNAFSILIVIIQFLLYRKLENNKKEFQKELDKHNIEYSEIQMKKIEKFNELIQCYLDLLNTSKNNKNLSDEKLKELGEKYNELKPYLFIYSSDETVKEFNKHTKTMSKPGNTNYETLGAFADLIIALRKDAGYDGTKLHKDDLLEMMLKPGELEKCKLDHKLKKAA
ncbi:hypothetical protein HNP92_001779 [Methanococcus maripaludis]|uniref:Uncharacterized protein n=1 Tax=Methanococcus maripaludis TaxID=39152 RepID=A0A7J9S6N1_METMI|nr:hypothetical protein [Methanococcus maripaludis]MBB6402457.1 hypothetical protein [Methanococcus maripaludis]